ncbi:MAG: tRNA (5-methylaminomethyl-2-thiouridine)(34)-methyltransferase MnmD [Cyclobacteriaceae bacterium]
MTNHSLKLITTEDGSHSLLREDLNETYHSFHGARTESLYVFIEKCLEYYLTEHSVESVSIFEVGFGTGLNALLTANYAEKRNVLVDFHSVEPIPVPKDIYAELNFAESEEEAKILQSLHDSPWELAELITDNFSLTKYQSTLEQFDSIGGFDMVYFDAFAPSKQAEIWNLENIEKCFGLLKKGGILTTYCAQGQFKRNLATVGFEVETLKGAMGKKEMVRAHKPK